MHFRIKTVYAVLYGKLHQVLSWYPHTNIKKVIILNFLAGHELQAAKAEYLKYLFTLLPACWTSVIRVQE